MSKVDELIQDHCPNGVRYRSLGSLCKIETGKLNANASVDDGSYLFFTTAKEISRIDSYRWDAEALLIAGNANVGDVKHYKGKFDAYQRTYVLSDFDENVNVRFLYFFISSALKNYLESRTNSAAMTYIVLSTLKDFKVPVPPLEVQNEIVNILDKFTQLEAELSAELDSRNKQYEYYRKQLLLTDESREGTRHLTLGDIGKVSMCKRIFKDQTSSVGDIPFYKIGTFGKAPDSFISQEVYDEYRRKYSFPKKGDILLSASGTIGRTVVYDGEDAYFQDSNIIWLDNDERIVTNPFLFHIYKIVKWQTEGGTIQRLYNDNLKKIKITVPSIDEQNRIVSILNKFETLVNGISEGLPAEITARRQQYEYYRAKLLTFQELPV